MRRSVYFLTMVAMLAIPAGMSAKPVRSTSESVRRELAMLPRYGVFDTLAYQIDGGVVTLTGQVTEPVVQADAEAAVRRVDGVTKVIDKIEVLPLSPFDNRIRLAAYRAVYGAPSLSARYGLGAVPAIRIIVKNGRVRLEGVVANEADRVVAGMRANSVAGAFEVQNELTVAR